MGKVLHPHRVGEPAGEPAELVLDAIGNDERENIADYLGNAAGLFSMGYWTDPVTDDPKDVIPFVLATDGSWVWGTPWEYFVDSYGAALPADFLTHIRALEYQPPEVSEERAREIGIAEGVIPSDDFWTEYEARQAEKDLAQSEEAPTQSN